MDRIIAPHSLLPVPRTKRVITDERISRGPERKSKPNGNAERENTNHGNTQPNIYNWRLILRGNKLSQASHTSHASQHASQYTANRPLPPPRASLPSRRNPRSTRERMRPATESAPHRKSHPPSAASHPDAGPSSRRDSAPHWQWCPRTTLAATPAMRASYKT